MPRIDQYPEITSLDPNDYLLVQNSEGYRKVKKKVIQDNLSERITIETTEETTIAQFLDALFERVNFDKLGYRSKFVFHTSLSSRYPERAGTPYAADIVALRYESSPTYKFIDITLNCTCLPYGFSIVYNYTKEGSSSPTINRTITNLHNNNGTPLFVDVGVNGTLYFKPYIGSGVVDIIY